MTKEVHSNVDPKTVYQGALPQKSSGLCYSDDLHVLRCIMFKPPPMKGMCSSYGLLGFSEELPRT